MKYEYLPDLHIASIEDDILSGIKVLTTVQCPSKKQPAIAAFLGARYSRSGDSVKDIATEVQVNNKDAADRLANIYGNYGHASVAGLAHVPLYIENIPMFLAFKIFNWVPTHDGQERSTRYQDFSNPNFVKLPTDFSGTTLWDTFYQILNKQVNDYQALHDFTYTQLEQTFVKNKNNVSSKRVLESRTLDTTRYLLPSGLLTSMSLLTCAREWSSLVSKLEINGYVDNQLAGLIKNIFEGVSELTDLGYVPEIDTLFKYRGEKQYELEALDELINILKSEVINKYSLSYAEEYHITKLYSCYAELDYEQILQNCLRIIYPGIKYGTVNQSHNNFSKLGQVFGKYFNNYQPMGQLGKTSPIMFQGYMDLGAARDINRHRSLNRQFPITYKQYDMELELKRPEHLYTLCPYLALDGMSWLAREYHERLSQTYDQIHEWYDEASQTAGVEFANEFVKYLLPLAHSTSYCLGGDFNSLSYFCHLRHKPGGHIAYREFAYTIAQELANSNPLYKGLLNSLNPVDFTSIEQFFNRT
jgi:thymidylate synthase ThyX